MCTRLRIEFQDERRGWRSRPSMSKPALTNHMTICSVAKNSSCRAVPGSALCAGPIKLAYSPIQSKLFIARCFHPSGYRRQGYDTDRGPGPKARGARGARGFSPHLTTEVPLSSFVCHLHALFDFYSSLACLRMVRSSIHYYGTVLSAS